MSNWCVLKADIKNPNREVLKKALEELANELGVELREKTMIYGYSMERLADFGLMIRGTYGNGIGVSISEDGIEVFGDTHGMRINIHELREKINQLYIKHSVIEALNELGYVYEVVKDRENIVIDVVVST